MKKLVTLLILCSGLFVSCYDDTALIERIDALEQSTIASLKVSISSLEAQSTEIKASIASLEQSEKANATEISNLKTSLTAIETKIAELKAWIETLLEGYYSKDEIDTQIAALNTELETLRTSISSIESTLATFMREFIITFDDTEIGILAGGTTSVGYTITGATDKTTVKALGQNGWSAKVTPEGTDKGKITVTAPNPLTEDEIIVLVYDGEYRTIMSSINFVTGVVTPSQTAVELEAAAGTVDIAVTSNLNYKVSIPEDAKDWLSVVETKATKTENITFAYTANEFSIRRADVLFVDETYNVITKVSFIQQGSATEVILSEAGTLLDTIGHDLYKNIKSLKIKGYLNSSDMTILNRMINLVNLDISEAIIADEDLIFQGTLIRKIITPNNIKSIRPFAFSNCENLEEITIGTNVEEIGEYAFWKCCNLSVINFNNNLQSIGDSAFEGCSSILDIILPESLYELGSLAFRSCTQLKQILLPEGLKDIKRQVFNYCSSLESISLPSSINSIGEYSFYHCDNLKEIHVKSLPSTLTSISKNISDNYSNVIVYIPEGTYNDYFLTPLGNFTNLLEE